MTDYYDELNLSSSLDTATLYQEISKLESLWRRREVTNPEKAAKMIALIVEAQEKFKDEQSRRDYDLQLDQSKRKPKQLDPNTERLQSFMEWRNKAVSFYDEQQYDLAKSALDKALSYMPADYEDSLFFNQAALIYVNNNDCNAAMDYINKAIIIDSDIPDYYLTKGLVFNTIANKQYVDYSDKQTFHEKSEKMFLKAHELAARKNISIVRANAAGALARYYSFINDEARAETFAQEAVQYGETWGNGQKVLNIIKSRKAAREKAQQEQQRREKEARRRQEEEKRRNEEARRKYEEQNEAKRRAEEKHTQKMILWTKILGILNLIVGVILVLFEIRSLTPPRRNYLDEPPIFVFMYAYSMILAIEFQIIIPGKHRLNRIVTLFFILGILDVAVYTIAYIVRRSDFGALIMFPLVGFGSWFIWMRIIEFIIDFICTIKNKLKK